MAKDLTPEELQQEAASFRDGFLTVLLATVSPQGQPDASYAPCVVDDTQAVYVFISELAQHTKNLLAVPQASLLFIADETGSKNIFARRRLSLNCTAEVLPRDHSQWNHLLAQFEDKFGNTINLLKTLPDFHLIRFSAGQGNYVRGFAQAYTLSGNQLEIHSLRTR